MSKKTREQLPPVVVQLPAEEQQDADKDNPQDVVWGFPKPPPPVATATAKKKTAKVPPRNYGGTD